jgi:membrane-bound lytic murein transglycosylase MltF
MRLILKKEKRRPKAPKSANLATLDRYYARVKEVEKYNAEVRKYNKSLCVKASAVQKAVAGFGKKSGK